MFRPRRSCVRFHPDFKWLTFLLLFYYYLLLFITIWLSASAFFFILKAEAIARLEKN